MIQGFTRCATYATYTLPSSILVTGTVLRPVSLLRSPSSSPEPFSILVFGTVLRPVSGTVLHPRLRNRSPSSSSEPFSVPSLEPFSVPSLEPFSVPSPEPFSVPSPEPSFILVFSPVHRIRHRRRPPFPFSAAQFFWNVTKKSAKNRYLQTIVFFSSFKITDYISGL